MKASLSFQFPQRASPVPITIFIPLPEQRPRTVANFIYMCTGELPPPGILTALRVDTLATPLAFSTSEAAREAGLKPFRDTAIVRVDKALLVEVGSSPSKTIFGGFTEDEKVHLPPAAAARGSVAATMSQLKAGTVLVGNIGQPNSNGSRYYILLHPATTLEQREELSQFLPLGMVSSGLDELVKEASKVAVHPRTLCPTKKIELAQTSLEWDYRALLAQGPSAAQTAAAASSGEADRGAATRQPHERKAGRAHRRDEDEEDNEDDGDGEVHPKGRDGETTGEKGFFQLSATFPTTRSAGVDASGRGMKRRRVEVVSYDEDGLPVLRNTAVEPGDGEGFDFFDAQQAAFLNDIEVIKDTQTTRLHHRMQRMGKQTQFSKASSKELRQKALKSISGRTTKGKASSAAGSSSGGAASKPHGNGKRTNRKY